MGRLHAVTIVLALAVMGALVGCPGPAPPSSSAPAAPAPVRAVGVEASTAADIDGVLAGLCDVHHPAATAPRYAAPETTPRSPARREAAWAWVNYWATWCEPCVREFPLLRAELADSVMDLVLLSTDDDAAAVARFAEAHAPGAVLPLVAGGDAHVAAIGRTAGLGDTVALPMHLLVDPEGRIRCARVGEVAAADVRAVVEAVGGARARRIR